MFKYANNKNFRDSKGEMCGINRITGGKCQLFKKHKFDGGGQRKVHLLIPLSAVASCLLIGPICDAWSKPRPSAATCRAEVETVDLCTWHEALLSYLV